MGKGLENNDAIAEDGIRLFVYGTLRRRGVAKHFLQEYAVKEEGVWVSGFAMFDAGWYPFVVPAAENSRIVGDLYEIPQWKMAELDEYEGPGYTKSYLEKLQAFIYVKADGDATGFPKVPGGDWLEYWERKSG